MESLQRPARGSHVDSISYYTQDLAATSRALMKLQRRKTAIAATGNRLNRADGWIDKAMVVARQIANQIMEDSAEDNSLLVGPPQALRGNRFSGIPQVENMTSMYGSFGYQTPIDTSTQGDHCNVQWNVMDSEERRTTLLSPSELSVSNLPSTLEICLVLLFLRTGLIVLFVFSSFLKLLVSTRKYQQITRKTWHYGAEFQGSWS